jgi:hypothetical protein
VVKGVEDQALSKLSPFAINRGVVGLLGEPDKIGKLKDDTMLAQARTERQAGLSASELQLAGENPGDMRGP